MELILMSADWYTIQNIDRFDTPCLVIYKDRVSANIQEAIRRIGNVELLRPHVKTNKIAEVCRMMMSEGIYKFKCATIAEAEMLAQIEAPDVLLAYQPIEPRGSRFLQLVQTYPNTTFSCVLDNQRTAEALSSLFDRNGLVANVYIDINTGMNRTGVTADAMYALADNILSMPGLNLVGLHTYDGHIRDKDFAARQRSSDESFKIVAALLEYLASSSGRSINVVAGGSPSFATHVSRHVECSPGTFVFWDWGYHTLLPDENYGFAAVLVTRVLSIIDQHTMTTDLGYKAVAAENPLPRIHFFNISEHKQVGQSEEHLVLWVPDSSTFKPGDVLYGVPYHICPTVALYDEVFVAVNNEIIDSWKVTARARRITI